MIKIKEVLIFCIFFLLFAIPANAGTEFWTDWKGKSHNGIASCDLSDARTFINKACNQMAAPIPGGRVVDRQERKFSNKNWKECCNRICIEGKACRSCKYYIEYRCKIIIP